MLERSPPAAHPICCRWKTFARQLLLLELFWFLIWWVQQELHMGQQAWTCSLLPSCSLAHLSFCIFQVMRPN